MWFGYRGEESNWIPVTVDRVKEIMTLNEKGIKPQTIDGAESAKIEMEIEKGTGPLNADLDKMDRKYGGNGGKKNFDKKKGDRPDFKSEKRDTPRPERERREFKQEKRGEVKPEQRPVKS